jgi:uncharacterized membrane protein YeaQ/YmgE (transglycosylase-associated protein family)
MGASTVVTHPAVAVTLEQLLLVAGAGLLAGFLASRLAGGHGYGTAGDAVVGIVGASIGAFVLEPFVTDHLLAPMGVAAGSAIAQGIVAGACGVILLAALRVFAGSGLAGHRREGRRLYERRVYARRFWSAVSWPTRMTDDRRIR